MLFARYGRLGSEDSKNPVGCAPDGRTRDRGRAVYSGRGRTHRREGLEPGQDAHRRGQGTRHDVPGAHAALGGRAGEMTYQEIDPVTLMSEKTLVNPDDYEK